MFGRNKEDTPAAGVVSSAQIRKDQAADADPGLNPRSPLMTVGPVLVTVLPPRTAKFVAVPNRGCVAASAAIGHAASTNAEATIDTTTTGR